MDVKGVPFELVEFNFPEKRHFDPVRLQKYIFVASEIVTRNE